MISKNNLITGIVLSLGLTAGAWMFRASSASGEGEALPDFTLRDACGQAVRIHDYKGQVIVLDFWASWCGPCLAAMPAMHRLYADYADDGLVLFGVNINDTKDPNDTLYELGVSYPILVKGERVAQEFGVRGIPTILVIDRDGTIVHRSSGWSPSMEHELADLIESLL